MRTSPAGPIFKSGVQDQDREKKNQNFQENFQELENTFPDRKGSLNTQHHGQKKTHTKHTIISEYFYSDMVVGFNKKMWVTEDQELEWLGLPKLQLVTEVRRP